MVQRRKALIFSVMGTVLREDRAYLPGVEYFAHDARKYGWVLLAVHQVPGELERRQQEVSRRLKQDLGVAYTGLCGHTADVRCLCHRPQPFLVQKVMAWARIEPENCVFIGSRPEDIYMAKAAEIKRVHFAIPNTAGFADIVRKVLK